MKRAALATASVGVLLALFLASGAMAATDVFVTHQLTVNGNYDIEPQVSGDRIVWQGEGGSDGGGDKEIFTWTGAGGTAQITRNDTADGSVDVDGDRVVWCGAGGSDAGVDDEPFTWTPSRGVRQLNTDDYPDSQPQVSGDRIVWRGADGMDPIKDREIFTWTPAGDTLRLTNNHTGDWHPCVMGERVAWYGHPEEGVESAEIFTWTPAGGVVRLTTNTAIDSQPQIGDLIVWRGTRGSDGGTDQEIFAWTPGDGITQLTVNDHDDWDPQIAGDRVTWFGAGGSDDGEDDEIFTWTPGGGTVQLTVNDTNDWSPMISGDRIVWQGEGGSDGGTDFEVFTWTPSGGTVQLTVNNTDDRQPQVSGHRIVWQGEGGSDGGIDTEVFTATLASATFPDVAASHPYYAAISELSTRNIITGYLDGRFGPTDAVVRQQFAKMIVLALELEPLPAEQCPFSDVEPGWPYPRGYIATAAERGITTGTTPGTFSPWDTISRAQVVTMVVRALTNLAPGTLRTPPAVFTGTLGSFDATHGPTMATAEHNGLLQGLLGFGSAWDPWANATRGEVAQVLWNLRTPVDSTTTPMLISPQNGAVFGHFPRTTELRWMPVPHAAAYVVEVEYFDPWSQGWIVWFSRRVSETSYVFDFVGMQPGRWRVSAQDISGLSWEPSDWWVFDYTI